MADLHFLQSAAGNQRHPGCALLTVSREGEQLGCEALQVVDVTRDVRYLP